jgi:hypothetical protein
METVVSPTVIPALKRNGLACFMGTICCVIVNPLAAELIPGVICTTHEFKLQDLIFSCKLLHTHTHKGNIYLILDTNMRYIEMSEFFARLYVFLIFYTL